MFTSVFLVPIGMILDRRTRLLVGPCLVFVLLYSFLPHKELRFIIYVFPLLNVAVAEACKRAWENVIRKPSLFTKLWCSIAVLHVVANLIFSSLMLYISSYNYPGGKINSIFMIKITTCELINFLGSAMLKLHELEDPNTNVYVHICNYAAQTGVSRFTQINENWIYNKTEHLTVEELSQFQHLLVESSDHEIMNFLANSHKSLDEISAFNGFSMNLKSFPPNISVKFKPAVTILKKLEKEDTL